MRFLFLLALISFAARAADETTRPLHLLVRISDSASTEDHVSLAVDSSTSLDHAKSSESCSTNTLLSACKVEGGGSSDRSINVISANEFLLWSGAASSAALYGKASTHAHSVTLRLRSENSTSVDVNTLAPNIDLPVGAWKEVAVVNDSHAGKHKKYILVKVSD